MSAPQEFRARVSAKQMLTPKILEVRLALVAPAEIRFHAGQFIQFQIAPRLLRHYSIASPPSASAAITLCADIYPGGVGSSFLLALAEGGDVRFRGPFGAFVVDAADDRPREFIATGAGIAPLRSMLMGLLAEPSRTAGVPAELHLLFGNRSEEFLFYDEEFRALAANHPRFRYTPTLSQPSPGWAGERGRVNEVLARRTDLAGRAYYICGSPEMVDDTRAALKGQGIPEADLHFEKFT